MSCARASALWGCRLASRTWAAFGGGDACGGRCAAGASRAVRAALLVDCGLDYLRSSPVAACAGLRIINQRGKRRAEKVRRAGQPRRSGLGLSERRRRLLQTHSPQTTRHPRCRRRLSLFETLRRQSWCPGTLRHNARNLKQGLGSSNAGDYQLPRNCGEVIPSFGLCDPQAPLLVRVLPPSSSQVRSFAGLRRSQSACFPLESSQPRAAAGLRRSQSACFCASSAVSDSVDESEEEEEQEQEQESSPTPSFCISDLLSAPVSPLISGEALVQSEKEVNEEMAASVFSGEQASGIAISNGKLVVHGTPILTGVPDNITLSANETLWGTSGAFLGAKFDNLSSRHVVSLGVLRDLRFVCCFRFKLWWMAQGVGCRGKDVPVETQFLLLEGPEMKASGLGNRSDSSDSLSELVGDEGAFGEDPFFDQGGSSNGKRVYTVFLPLLEKAFRACLHGNEKDELELCLESGDPAVQTNSAAAAVYISSGSNPFNIITEAVRAVEAHSQSFMRRERKKMPGMLDYFGWCTWDAFYTDVTAEGILEGLSCLAEGGAPARFVIIDDGWQSTGRDQEDDTVAAAVTAGTQYAKRLTALKSNRKFQKEIAAGESSGEVAPSGNFGHFVMQIKEKFNLKYVYVWHALTGYWGGVCPNSVEMEHYTPSLKFPVPSPGVLVNQPDMAGDSLTLSGLGLVHPERAFDFFNELHSYLAASGIDGVKVDVQNILETLGAGFGGRVEITKMYHKALEESISQNFPDNGCIACMSHNTDGLYSAKQTAVVRASDDFWPSDPAAHTVHICSVAYNSLFLGEFMQPDWDMFHSLHPAAEFHAAARAIGGCAVYVSDKPGNHDFNVLRKLVLPDGRILRARFPGRPTRDCLFVDPARDGCSLLKIWNVNVVGGVVGAFNCQGSGWCKSGLKYVIHDPAPNRVSGHVKVTDVDSLGALVADENWNGDAAVYSYRGGELKFLPRGQSSPVSLGVLEFEVFTIVPIKALSPGVLFAPIGLVDMYNSGGAILFISYSYETEGDCLHDGRHPRCEPKADDASVGESITMAVRGCGRFVSYSSRTPKACMIDAVDADYTFSEEDCRLSLGLERPVDGHVWTVKIVY